MGQPNSLGTLEILISLSVCLLVDFKIFTRLPAIRGQRHNLSFKMLHIKLCHFFAENNCWQQVR